MHEQSEKLRSQYRTWIEIEAEAVRRNIHEFRKLIAKDTQLWSVVKSNAYGHGIGVFSRLADKYGVDGFCVDSLVEGIKLRREGISKPILVTGYTIPALFPMALENKITLAVSTFENLKALANSRQAPDFHLKIDTGMHRHGFYIGDLPPVLKFLDKSREAKSSLRGIFTHFAAAKDITYPQNTEEQFKNFLEAQKLFEEAGYKKIFSHAAATGGTLMNKKYHLDAVRVGIGLYGLFPSRELAAQKKEVRLKPVLSWRAVVGEVKKIKKGDYIGYDLTERAPQSGKIAILPVGYWHGMGRAASSAGTVLIRGKRAKLAGRVSMDITTVFSPPGSASENVATIIGRDGRDEISAAEAALSAGTVHYELLTRLNPLIERVVV